MTIYYNVELIYDKGKYDFYITEIQADAFIFNSQHLDMELDRLYSIPNQKTWIYVKHEEPQILDKWMLEKNERKKKLLLFKAKNKLINYENGNLNVRVNQLNDLQYEIKQNYNKRH